MMKKLLCAVAVVFCGTTVVGCSELADSVKKDYKWAKENKTGKDGDELGFGEEIDKFFLDETEKPEATKTPEVTEAPEVEEKNTDNGTLLDIHPEDIVPSEFTYYDTLEDAIKNVPNEIKEATDKPEYIDHLVGSSRCIESSELFKDTSYINANICIMDARFERLDFTDNGDAVITVNVPAFGESENYIKFVINNNLLDSIDFSKLNTMLGSNQPLEIYGFRCGNITPKAPYDDVYAGIAYMQGYYFEVK